MKIKLDENLPLRPAPFLNDLGHNVHTVHGERRSGHADTEVWRLKKKTENQLRKLSFMNNVG